MTFAPNVGDGAGGAISTVRSYRAYGLAISSAVPLSDLEEGPAGSDVIVRLGSTGPWPEEPVPSGGIIEGGPDPVRMIWPDVGSFLVHGGREVIADPAPAVPARTLSLLLTGPVLAAILSQRGLMVVHAAGVQVGEGAVLFAGPSGSGKSTLAAAMLERGHRLIADDVTAIDLRPQVPEVLPGSPYQKLWPDSARAVGLQPEALPLLLKGEAKRGRQLHEPVPRNRLPLRRVYRIEDGDHLQIEPLSGVWAFVSMMASSYVARMLEACGESSAHFQRCTGLLNRADFRRLRRPRQWGQLPEVIRAVERDLED